MIIDSLIAGGKERRLVQLLKGFTAQKKGDITLELVVLSDRIHYQEVYSLGIKLHIIKRNPAMDPRVFYKLVRICRKFKPDIVQCWDSMGAVFGAPVAKLLGIKFINGMIVAAPKRIKKLSNLWLRSRLTFPFSDVILSNSEAGLASFQVKADKAFFIHNGLDLTRFNQLKDKSTVRQELGIRTQKVIGMVAAFSTRKDYKTFLAAGTKLVSERNDLSIVCVGDGKLLASCKESIPTDLKPYFIFTGRSSEVESIVNLFDIGVLSTITEGIPNAVMEYMYLGKPVVATDAGGTRELVLDQKTGFLTKKGDVETMYEKINYLLNDQNLASAMGEAGKTRIINAFSLEKMTEKFYNLYTKLISNQSLK